MGDDHLQREGGNAILNSLSHAVKPGVIRWVELLPSCVASTITFPVFESIIHFFSSLFRIAGFGLVVLSISFFKFITSPF